MVDLTYLPGAIPFAFLIYFLMVYVIYKRYLLSVDDSQLTLLDTPLTSDLPYYESSQPPSPISLFFTGKDFENVYQSIWSSLESTKLLLAWRAICFGFFFSLFIWGNVDSGGGNAYFFTLWNVYLITLYYFLALTSSIIGFLHGPTESDAKAPKWSDRVQTLGYAVQILYEVAGSTALFVTIVNFSALNHHFVFKNVSRHLATTLSLLVECALNKISVRYEHLIFNLTWVLLYMMFCWPMVASGALHDWPYFFLSTDTPAVFAWYMGLFAMDTLFYSIWFYIIRTKESYFNAPNGQDPQGRRTGSNNMSYSINS
jgi:hypothetical protein